MNSWNGSSDNTVTRKLRQPLEDCKCRGCGQIEKFPRNSGRHYCNCNPTAKHEMVPVALSRIADEVLGTLKIGAER